MTAMSYHQILDVAISAGIWLVSFSRDVGTRRAPWDGMNTTTHEFGVRYQGAGIKGDVGWRRRPLSRSEAWKLVQETTNNDLVDMIEVVDFTLDKVTYVVQRDHEGKWQGGAPQH